MSTKQFSRYSLLLTLLTFSLPFTSCLSVVAPGIRGAEAPLVPPRQTEGKDTVALTLQGGRGSEGSLTIIPIMVRPQSQIHAQGSLLWEKGIKNPGDVSVGLTLGGWYSRASLENLDTPESVSWGTQTSLSLSWALLADLTPGVRVTYVYEGGPHFTHRKDLSERGPENQIFLNLRPLEHTVLFTLVPWDTVLDMNTAGRLRLGTDLTWDNHDLQRTYYVLTNSDNSSANPLIFLIPSFSATTLTWQPQNTPLFLGAKYVMTFTPLGLGGQVVFGGGVVF